jgi:signal peptidase I
MGTRGKRAAEPGSAETGSLTGEGGEESRADSGRGGKSRRSSGMSRADRRRIARRAERRRKRSFLRELPIIAVVALLIALLMKTFLLQVFVVPSGSMEKTIRIGDRVLVDKLSPWFGKQPQRGDVVVFKDPGYWLETEERAVSQDGTLMHAIKQVFVFVGLLPSETEGDLIKRVIGISGDTVACCDSDGRVTVNGTPTEEPYLAPGIPPSRQPFKVTVPSGRLWVMGDNRDVSADSRFHMTDASKGTIPVANVIGRAVAVAWPASRIQQLSASDYRAPLRSGTVASAAGQPDRSGYDRSPASRSLGPTPGEPSLVMGVAAALPYALRRWRHRVAPRG